MAGRCPGGGLRGRQLRGGGGRVLLRRGRRAQRDPPGVRLSPATRPRPRQRVAVRVRQPGRHLADPAAARLAVVPSDDPGVCPSLRAESRRRCLDQGDRARRVLSRLPLGGRQRSGPRDGTGTAAQGGHVHRADLRATSLGLVQPPTRFREHAIPARRGRRLPVRQRLLRRRPAVLRLRHGPAASGHPVLVHLERRPVHAGGRGTPARTRSSTIAAGTSTTCGRKVPTSRNS